VGEKKEARAPVESRRTSLGGGLRPRAAQQAALLAGRHHATVVTAQEFDNAILRTVAGVEKKRSILTVKEKNVVAKHEASDEKLVGGMIPLTPRRFALFLFVVAPATA
jgi:cell division protease FtsH